MSRIKYKVGEKVWAMLSVNSLVSVDKYLVEVKLYPCLNNKKEEKKALKIPGK